LQQSALQLEAPGPSRVVRNDGDDLRGHGFDVIAVGRSLCASSVTDAGAGSFIVVVGGGGCRLRAPGGPVDLDRYALGDSDPAA
jgi:hypothetical protein